MRSAQVYSGRCSWSVHTTSLQLALVVYPSHQVNLLPLLVLVGHGVALTTPGVLAARVMYLMWKAFFKTLICRVLNDLVKHVSHNPLGSCMLHVSFISCWFSSFNGNWQARLGSREYRK